MNLWALCGMGYTLGQFFQLKYVDLNFLLECGRHSSKRGYFRYVVMYGWSCFVAKLDGLDVPPHPKCIGRIHLYSDMWRHFDNGLYLFMQKYIYR